MLFITGGAFQGKTAFAKQHLSLSDDDFTDGGSCPLEDCLQKPVFKRLHLLIKRLLEAGRTEGEIEALLLDGMDKGRCLAILTDEIGCGVVPMEPFERMWRETAGRIACKLAAKADAVVLMQCGLPMVLKGELPKGEKPWF